MNAADNSGVGLHAIVHDLHLLKGEREEEAHYRRARIVSSRLDCGVEGNNSRIARYCAFSCERERERDSLFIYHVRLFSLSARRSRVVEPFL